MPGRIEQQRLFIAIGAHHLEHPVGRFCKPGGCVGPQQCIDLRLEPEMRPLPRIAIKQIDVWTPARQFIQCRHLGREIVLAPAPYQADRE